MTVLLLWKSTYAVLNNPTLQTRDVSDAKISKFADADAYANICACRSTEADAHANTFPEAVDELHN